MPRSRCQGYPSGSGNMEGRTKLCSPPQMCSIGLRGRSSVDQHRLRLRTQADPVTRPRWVSPLSEAAPELKSLEYTVLPVEVRIPPSNTTAQGIAVRSRSTFNLPFK